MIKMDTKQIQTTVWDIPENQKSETGHSTQKPAQFAVSTIMNKGSKGPVERLYEKNPFRQK
jgi:hypothetical protein